MSHAHAARKTPKNSPKPNGQKDHSLALVHDLLLRPDLDRRQLLHRLLVVAEAPGDLLVEGVHQVLEGAAEGLGEVVGDRGGAGGLDEGRVLRVQQLGRVVVDDEVAALPDAVQVDLVLVLVVGGGGGDRPVVRLLELGQGRLELQLGHFAGHVTHRDRTRGRSARH